MPRVKRKGHVKRGEDIPVADMRPEELRAELDQWLDGDLIDDLHGGWREFQRTAQLQNELSARLRAEHQLGPLTKARIEYWTKLIHGEDWRGKEKHSLAAIECDRKWWSEVIGQPLPKALPFKQQEETHQ